jgi:Ca-activated chloride channel family protein
VAADAPPPQSAATVSQPPDLSATIAELSAKPALATPDYARLATDTIGFASQPSSPRGAPRDGIIDDALAAVARGEQRDAHAADWPALRRQLEALRKPPEEPKNQQQQKQDQEQKQDQQQQQGNNDQQQQQNQQSSGGSSQDEQQPQNGGGGEPQKQDGTPASQDQKAQAKPSSGADQQQAERGDRKDRENADAPSPSEQPQQSGEVKRQQETKPVDSAGLGDEQKDQHADAPSQEQKEAQNAPQPPQGTRLVGGGQVGPEAPQSSDPATADALARMEHVKDGDAPAVLFDRMNRADGQPPPQQNGKNW